MKRKVKSKVKIGFLERLFEESSISKDLLLTMESFQSKLSAELCLSQNTISSYMSDIAQFIRWNGSEGFAADSLRLYLAQNQFSNASMRRKISSITLWKNFCKEEMQLEMKFEIPKIKVRKTVPKILSNEDVTKLLQHEELDLRLRTIILLFNATGMRISELLSMEYKDIQEVLERGAETFRIIGKGNKERTIFLDTISMEALLEYCAKNKITRGNIWGGITRQCVYLALKKLGQKAGVQQSRVYPHSFRHRIGSNLAQAGLSLIELQKFLGHASINTTSIYTHLEDELTYKMVMEKHPLGEGSGYVEE
jgi:integrase/recombinase XerD